MRGPVLAAAVGAALFATLLLRLETVSRDKPLQWWAATAASGVGVLCAVVYRLIEEVVIYMAW